MKYFNITNHTIQKAKKQKIFVTRSNQESMKLLAEQGKCHVQRIVWDEKRRKMQSEAKKELYRKYPEKHPNFKLANNKAKMSYPERLAYCYFEDNNMEFKHSFSIRPYFVDFLLSDNLIIEIDGEYFHQNKEYENKRDNYLKSKGYTILRFPADNIISRLNLYFNTEYQISKEESEKRIIKKEKPKCVICGSKTSSNTAKRCIDCWRKIMNNGDIIKKNHYRKVKNRPSKEELQVLIDTKPYTSIAKLYNICGNTVKNWAIDYGIYKRKHKPR
jgi:very-short-patch-repair endonuclease